MEAGRTQGQWNSVKGCDSASKRRPSTLFPTGRKSLLVLDQYRNHLTVEEYNSLSVRGSLRDVSKPDLVEQDIVPTMALHLLQ